MSLNPESITIDSTSKLFEYEKIAREVDNCDDTEVLQNMLKCYVKLVSETTGNRKWFPQGSSYHPCRPH